MQYNTGLLKKKGAKVKLIHAYCELQNHDNRIKLFLIFISLNLL